MNDELGNVLVGIAKASREDMRLIQDAFKARWNTLTKEEANAFSVGQRVFFNDRQGRRIEGDIEKINRKSINVRVGEFNSYRVSPSLLGVVE
jgi:ribosomal protein L35AE/L33A